MHVFCVRTQTSVQEVRLEAKRNRMTFYLDASHVSFFHIFTSLKKVTFFG